MVVAATAAVHYLLATVGMSLALPGDPIPPVWPATGVAVALAMLLGPRRVALGVFVGDLSLGMGLPYWPHPAFAVPAALGNALMVGLAAEVGRRLVRPERMPWMPIQVGFGFSIALVPTLVAATLGTTTLWVAGLLAPADVGTTWATWWLSDVVSVAFFTPFLLSWLLPPRPAWPRSGPAAAAILAGGGFLALISAASLLPGGADWVQESGVFLSFAAVGWAALAGGQRGVGVMSLALGLMFIGANLHGLGPFVNEGARAGVLSLQALGATLAMTGYGLAAVLAQRGAALHDAEAARAGLEQRVAQRTAALAASNQRMRAEVEERVRAEETARASEARFRQLADNIDTVFWISTPDASRVLYVNPAYQRLTGLDPAPLAEDALSFLEHVHPDDVGAVAAAFAGGLRSGGPTMVEYRFQHPDGKELWVRQGSFPIRDASGEVVRWGGLATDITAEKLAEAALRQSHDALEAEVGKRTARLEATMRELETLSYSVSHDLRGPLRAIDGYAHAVREGCAGKLPPEGLDRLDRIRANAQDMASRLDDLQAVLGVGRSELAPASVDLTALAEDEARELGRREPARRVAWRIQPGLRAWGDPELLGLVVRHLVRNAWKFSAGRAAATLTVEAEARAGADGIAVRDDGAGFDPSLADQLFQPFARLHGADEFEGRGIGLALVQRALLRHGGWAEAHSDGPGRGASFWFTLPRKPAAPEPPVQTLTPEVS